MEFLEGALSFWPLLAVILSSVYAWSQFGQASYKLPPTVPGIPVFGNTFQIPAVQQGPWAKRLAEKYGEM